VANELNLDTLGAGKHYELQLRTGTPEDAEARRHEAAEEAKHRRRIQFWIIFAVMLLVLASLGCCLYLLVGGAPDDKKLASSILAPALTVIVSVLTGFALGRKTQ
jgi:membrane protein YdbS with pleckstrin-like domain